MTNVVPFSPPQGETLINLDAEAALIGALLIENTLADAVRDAVAGQDFYEPIHGRAFEAICAERSAGRNVNPILLKPYFEGDEALKELGGLAYFARLSGDAQGLLMAPELAAQIAELAARRRMRDAMAEATRACLDLQVPVADVAVLTSNLIAPENEVMGRGGSTFELLTIEALRQLPPPEWLIHETIVSDGLSIIYGDPGSGKSFVALDMALRVALGMDWHGVRTKRVGVLYIAGEGVRGIGKRIEGWSLHHRIDLRDTPFTVMPVAAQILEAGERAKLIRTIDEARRQLGFEVGCVVIDTVSRAIAGEDENGQETMSAFVRGCDEIKAHTGGALIGVHHSGKDAERGMRGSTVLLGGCDAAIRLTKDGAMVTLKVEKQKDAEEVAPAYFEMQKVHWSMGSPDDPGAELSTLVPTRRDAPSQATLNRDSIAQAFGMMADAWGAGKPLSSKPQTRDAGRYAPSIFAARLGGEASAWKSLLADWLESGVVAFEVLDRKNHISGLRVIDAIA